MNRILRIVGISTLLFVLSGKAAGDVSLADPVLCSFFYGQQMDSQKAKVDMQKNVTEWRFHNLHGSSAGYKSGADSGSVFAHRHERGDGVTVWLRQATGADLFTIWQDGTAYWSQHNEITGRKAAQQFRGTCRNVR